MLMISLTLQNLLIPCSAAMIIILVCLAINIRKRKTAEREIKEVKDRLEENYQELEEAYKQVTATQKELCVKYEELKRSEEWNKKMAFSDYLTGLPNRTAFTEMLDNIMATLRKEEAVAIMYIDLDNFKSINDSLGHSYGDELLIDVTERLKQILDEDDYLARFGGDEFILLTQNIEDIGLFEEKIKKVQKVFSYPFVLAMREFFVTTSIGVTFAPKDGKTTQSLVKNVDLAMYEAKNMGKSTYCFFNESINSRLLEKIEIQTELRKALEEDSFLVYYQPRVDLKTDRINGFEALVRWNHPEKGIILPDEFVNLAEETGLIVPIGKMVLFSACEMLKKWNNKGYKGLTMAVNLSPRQFKDVNIVDTVKEAVEAAGIDPFDLELEITEAVALDDLDYTTQLISVLQGIGIRFSLDDFGTGYSSMNYLKYLPVNNLKIDKSFLDHVLEDDNDRTIVSAIIALAQALHLNVIAEGVEHAGQEDFLKGVNCDFAQGFLYSMPLSGAQASFLLTQEFCDGY